VERADKDGTSEEGNPALGTKNLIDPDGNIGIFHIWDDDPPSET
jgi:hypothetical protein